MKAWVFTGAHEPFQLVERKTPQPAKNEVVVRVRAAGLCHSDVGCMEGVLVPMMPKKPPIILGHEIAGVVTEIGQGVSGYKVGDRVVAALSPEYSPGWTTDGGYATHCLLPTSCLLSLPDTVSFVQGAAATDAGQTSHNAVVTIGGARPGMRVGIVGLGGLGMTGARIAVLHGAQVYAAEPRRETWAAAKEQGVSEVVGDVTGLAPYQLDVIIDFAGFGVTTAGAIDAVRPGGTVLVVGLGRTEATISTGTLVGKSVTLRGVVGGRPSDTAAVLGHIAKGELTITANTIGFDEIPAGLERLQKGGVIGRIVAQLD